MNWSVLQQSSDQDLNQEVLEIKNSLIQKGFPKEILEDLKEEDILACKGATQVFTEVSYEPMSDEEYYSEEKIWGIQVTSIGVQLSGKSERYRIFHHFLWRADAKFYGTECIKVSPTSEIADYDAGWTMGSDITGQVLYTKNQTNYVSPYHSIEIKREDEYDTSDIFNGFPVQRVHKLDTLATFSMPRGGTNYRGYMTYSIKELKKGYMVISWFNYTHQTTPFQYPVMTAKESEKTFTLGKTNFYTSQTEFWILGSKWKDAKRKSL
ncbi:hypothetical protein P261_02679 [Lachnospiraceae bacterium TWA4]|nr:hypothetical protein P261_02679 [Lachnospiraceae bacterium TWA4]